MKPPQTSLPGCALLGSLFLFASGTFFAFAFLHAPPDPHGHDFPKWTYLVFLSGFYLPAIALGLVVVKYPPIARRNMEIFKKHPDKPWLWNHLWASGHISDRGAAEATFIWSMAITLTLLFFPGIYGCIAELPHHLARDSVTGWIGIAFCLPMFAWAAYATRRRLKFGQSVLELQTFPAAIGGDLAGTIQIQKPSLFPEGILLRLRCVRRDKAGSTAKSGPTFVYTTVWESEQSFRQTTQPAQHVEIPVRFEIPTDASPSDDSKHDGSIFWWLEASTTGLGINYWSRFSVPVFPVTATHVSHPIADNSLPQFIPAPPLDGPVDKGIAADPLPAGGYRVRFAAMRNAGPTISAAIWAVLFDGMATLSFAIPHAWFLGVLFLPFAIIATPLAIRVWFSTTTITISHVSFTVDNSFSILNRQRTFEVSQIRRIVPKIAFQSFDKAFYRLDVVCGNASYTIPAAIGSKLDADWLARELNKQMGLSVPDTK